MNMSDIVDRLEKHENGMGMTDGKMSEGKCRCVKKGNSQEQRVRIEVQKGK